MAETMFQRVGGTPAVTALVDLLYTKILSNQVSSVFFNGRDVTNVKAKQVELFSNALGSGTPYTGRGMIEIHTGLGITEAEFGLVGGMLSDSLKELNVPEDIHDAVMAFAVSQKADIVGH